MSLSRSAALLLFIIYLGFVSLGLPDGTLGVAWPAVHRDLGLSVGLAGPLSVLGTLLAACSGFLSGFVLRRLETGPVVAVSCVLTASGMVLIGFAPGASLLFASAVPLGLGAGAVDAGLNSFVARHYSGRHMNWLHACWGIGATGGPLLMAHFLAHGQGWRFGYFVLAGIQGLLALVFVGTLKLWRAAPAAHEPESNDLIQRVLPTLGANSEAGWISALNFALYVATETTLGLWASTILVETRGFAVPTAGLCAAGYYGAITAGRILVGFLVDSWGNRRVIRIGMGVALGGLALFAVAADPWLAGLGLILTGLGFAPVYPGLMHEVPRRFAPEAVFVVIGRQSGASYIGAAVCPALAGWLAAHFSPRSIVAVVLVGAVALTASILRLDALTPPPRSTP